MDLLNVLRHDWLCSATFYLSNGYHCRQNFRYLITISSQKNFIAHHMVMLNQITELVVTEYQNTANKKKLDMGKVVSV
jgi:hypothetical protein